MKNSPFIYTHTHKMRLLFGQPNNLVIIKWNKWKRNRRSLFVMWKKWKFRYLGTTSVAVVLFLRHGSSVLNNVHGNNSGSLSGARSYHEALYFPSSKIAERNEKTRKKSSREEWMLAFCRSTRSLCHWSRRIDWSEASLIQSPDPNWQKWWISEIFLLWVD